MSEAGVHVLEAWGKFRYRTPLLHNVQRVTPLLGEWHGNASVLKGRNMEPLDKQDSQAEERKRIQQEFLSGYPTRETIAQFLDAHKNGKGAIAELLEKRHALRLKKTE